MHGKLGWSRLFTWGKARSEPLEPDAADVGTAFGMEMSLQFEPTQASDEAGESDYPGHWPQSAVDKRRND